MRFYAVLSADGDVQDGIEPSLSIRDEVHRWKTARAETLRDVIVKGQISRDEPLDIGITTAGAEYESPMWWREYQHAKRSLRVRFNRKRFILPSGKLMPSGSRVIRSIGNPARRAWPPTRVTRISEDF